MSQIMLITFDRNDDEYDSRASGAVDFEDACRWARAAFLDRFPEADDLLSQLMVRFAEKWKAQEGLELAVPTAAATVPLPDGMSVGLIYQEF